VLSAAENPHALPPPAGPTAVGNGKDLTETPAGDYTLLHLSLEGAWGGSSGKDQAPARLILGLRDGRGVMAWVANPLPTNRGDGRGWVRENTVKCAGNRLAGVIRFGVAIGPAPLAIELDATVNGAQVTGRYVVRVEKNGHPFGFRRADETRGGCTGNVVSSADGLQAGQDWPWHMGIGGSYAGPNSGRPLITDLAKARPVWKSEEILGDGWGNWFKYDIGLYSVQNTKGGSASLAVAGGKVYVCHYVPSGPLDEKGEGFHRTPDATGQLEKWRKEWEAKNPGCPFPRDKVADILRLYSDTVVACLDGATGRTLWRTSLAARSRCVQTHKWRGMNPSPSVAGGRVFVFDLDQGLSTLDAATGKLLWEHRAAKPGHALGVGACVVGDIATFYGLAGLDAASGKTRWELKTETWAYSTALPWQEQGRTRLLMLNAMPEKNVVVHCVDPAGGKPLWAKGQESDIVPHHDLVILSGGILVGPAKGSLPAPEAGKDAGFALTAYRLDDDGMRPLWKWQCPVPAVDRLGVAAVAGRLFVSAEKHVFCLDLASSKELARVEGVGGARNQEAWLAEGRLFINPEGRHGGYGLHMLTSDPKDFRILTANWDPPQAQTTAYANMGNPSPVVDGRLFMRGKDAVYCYDLREKERR
jgi:outer membrane protein assembly factor BamB